MDIRVAAELDRAALHQLWQDTFGDDSTFIDASLDVYAGKGHIYVAHEGEALLSQLLAVPCKIGSFNGVYLYALATTISARGKGIMTKLMKYAEDAEAKQGAVFACLIPANAPLFDYYKTRGYTVTSKLFWQNILVKNEKTKNEALSTDVPNAGLLIDLRQNYATRPYVDFEPERLQIITKDLAQEGFRVFYASCGYALAKKQEDFVLIPEFFVQNGFDEFFYCAIASALNTTNLLISTTKPLDNVLQISGIQKPFALFKSLSDYFVLDTPPYMRFGFEYLTSNINPAEIPPVIINA